MKVPFWTTTLLALALAPAAAHADVTAVKGSAFGYQCTVTALGSSCSAAAAAPSVTLAADASNSPQTTTVPTANASAGPATIFSSGPLTVRTEGTLGAGGSVTSSTDIQNVNAGGSEPLTAVRATSSCSGNEAGVSGSAAISGGKLQTDSGDSDPTNTIPDHPAVEVPVPADPAPNTTIEGHLHIGTVTDSYKYVFNEQVTSADGVVTVTAVHERLLGPAAVGDVLVGQVVCWRSTASTPPPQPPTPDVTSPTLTALGMSPSAFRRVTGSRVSYRLSEDATVTFTVRRVINGRRSGGRCVSATKARRLAKPCTRYVNVPGSFTHDGKRGPNRFRFGAVVAGKPLAVGRYVLRATAADAAGNASAPQTHPFKITARSARSR